MNSPDALAGTRFNPETAEERAALEALMQNQFIAPLFDRKQYQRAVEDMIAATAPLVYAVVQDSLEGPDARIAAWGMDWLNHGVVVDLEDQTCFLTRNTDRLTAMYTVKGRCTARIVALSVDMMVNALSKGVEHLAPGWHSNVFDKLR
ncbi:hypothetical protein KCV87_14015 [Actinosynnema pretiosum subsp. pretiosum]|uniref:Uncharacterized protein n=1 Tax=Actinosynnema pretiosum subsp. pretiosum TaxID=103721 RepID=A0AA45R6U4_9PSEU|nr:hypothetical protein APASM_1250 [Actinosynnema pretiosum subsp. pretiosum]QUF07053.1 hypothetical protein KCV87_14015 [Actinosynnema pretiosum subsp. pretiosum]